MVVGDRGDELKFLVHLYMKPRPGIISVFVVLFSDSLRKCNFQVFDTFEMDIGGHFSFFLSFLV